VRTETTRRTVLFDGQGNVLASTDGRLNVLAVADVDADGTEELVLQHGFARVVGGRLQLPPAPKAMSCY
jgi:hypothetical protein